MSDQTTVAATPGQAGRPRGTSCPDGRRGPRARLGQARPDPRGRPHHPQLRRHDRGGRRPPRGAARHHHRPDRAQRRRQDDVLQPDHRLRQADLGQVGSALVVRGPQARQDLGIVGRAGRDGPHLPADQVPQPDDGDGQHDAGGPRPARREPPHQHVQVDLGRAGEGHRGEGHRAAPPVPAARQEGRLRRQPVRRPAQAPRDGPGPDERPDDDHARRADGRREPRPRPSRCWDTSRRCATRA